MAYLETKYYRLEKLVKWEHVDEVNSMLLEQHISPKRVSEWCKEKGFPISHPKLYEYKEILQTAIAKQVSVERLLGIGVPKRSPIVLQALGLGDAKNLVKTEMEVLDGIIQHGFSALLHNPEIKIGDALRAIELKNKLTQGGHGGLTGYGLDQLRELETRKFNALLEVVLKYLPEDKHEELQEALEEAERKFYEDEAPEYLDEYEKSIQEELNANPDVVIVSNEK